MRYNIFRDNNVTTTTTTASPPPSPPRAVGKEVRWHETIHPHDGRRARVVRVQGQREAQTRRRQQHQRWMDANVIRISPNPPSLTSESHHRRRAGCSIIICQYLPRAAQDEKPRRAQSDVTEERDGPSPPPAPCHCHRGVRFCRHIDGAKKKRPYPSLDLHTKIRACRIGRMRTMMTMK